jgi:hypothetical protein
MIMATTNTSHFTIKNLTVRDIIAIVSVTVSVALQWGVFGTRITVLEKEVALLETSATAVDSRIERLNEDMWKLQAAQQEQQHSIDNIYQTIGGSSHRQ